MKILEDSSIADNYELRQFRFPKSKKKRIRKKWSKKLSNYKLIFISFKTILLPNGTLLVSSKCKQQINDKQTKN